MKGYLSLVLHAHLPFVRHPEHEMSLEETWLFEGITETYIPLLQILEGWHNDGMRVRLTLTLTPTLCSMLLDPLLQDRYLRHLERLIELAERETHRTHWEKSFNELATFYLQRFKSIRDFYLACNRNLIEHFRELQEAGLLEIITSAATHAVLPLLANHPSSLRAQVLVARDHYRTCFGREPRGIWLPECAYCEGLEKILHEADLRWFIIDSHGILNAHPRPRYAIFAPILTTNGIAAFGRDFDSARQVWSRQEGYPGDPRYRDFYRDIGFDLDLDYLKPYLPAKEKRSFTGIKYYRISHEKWDKRVYDRNAAVHAADEHANHFLKARISQMEQLAEILDRPPFVFCPYDAELFGHWWYEGPEFLNYFVRKAYYDQKTFTLITPQHYLVRHPSNQVATPAASTWGEGGHLGVWLNEKNQWIYPHLQMAQERMTELAGRFEEADALQARALKQAGRELLLAQSSDWPFMLRTDSSPEYARQRVTDHLLRFTYLYEQLNNGRIDEQGLSALEARDNIFPDLNYRYWLDA
jgi:1,4-alpha-glucan branching enzyme